CATVTKPSSQVRVQQLKDAHLAFIDHHTCVEGTPATWDRASFDSEVAKITQQFTDAEAAESKAVPARKEFIKNSAKLFQRDAALVRKQHCLSPSFAANSREKLRGQSGTRRARTRRKTDHRNGGARRYEDCAITYCCDLARTEPRRLFRLAHGTVHSIVQCGRDYFRRLRSGKDYD